MDRSKYNATAALVDYMVIGLTHLSMPSQAKLPASFASFWLLSGSNVWQYASRCLVLHYIWNGP